MSSSKAKSGLVTPAIKKKVVDLRRKVHMYPELQFKEFKTQKLILAELKKLGVKAKKIAGTGVVATIPGAKDSKDGKALMLRADMDALPVTEEIKSPYMSRHEGRMHACGHDAHVAILICVAQLLKEHPVDGPVKLVFQPAEEGGVGAQGMIDDGVLENPSVSAAFALHVWAGIPTGKMGIVLGPAMAAVDEFDLIIKGIAGHAAYPQGSIDPIYISAQVINSLQSIVSRNVDPMQTAVVSVASIHGGMNYNVIPPEVKLQGTCRTFTDENRRTVKKRLFSIVKGTAKALGGSVEIDYRHMIPATVNDKNASAYIWDASVDVLGKRNVYEADAMMGGEDMGLYLRRVPGCFAFLGVQNKKIGAAFPHHHPKFAIDEDGLPDGVEIMYRTAKRYFESINK